MRPEARIDAILARLKEHWKENSDIRLGQLLVNLTRDLQCSLFYVEDDEIYARLGEAIGIKREG